MSGAALAIALTHSGPQGRTGATGSQGVWSVSQMMTYATKVGKSEKADGQDIDIQGQATAAIRRTDESLLKGEYHVCSNPAARPAAGSSGRAVPATGATRGDSTGP
jgi:hypothetical protein